MSVLDTVCKKDMCTGCMACIDSCSKKAIQIVDSLKSYNAVIDKSKCIDCGVCSKVCQVNNPLDLKKPLYWCEGWSNSKSIRSTSSSGGYAQAIEKAFVRNGGWVCSCLFVDGCFRFALVNHEEEVEQFAGSKYVKSNPTRMYKAIREKLKTGDKVLFVGLPCQVAALKAYLHNNERNLYTIDLICHGSPSPSILELFLNDFGYSLNDIEKISFREKNRFQLSKHNASFTVPVVTDSYTATFLKSTIYTENCYSCPYATINRVSDISLGDSWGSEQPKGVTEQGISFALVQSEKGMELMHTSDLHMLEASLERAVEFNHQLRHPSVKPQERDAFFESLNRGKGFRYAVRKCYPARYYKSAIKTLLYKMRILGETVRKLG